MLKIRRNKCQAMQDKPWNGAPGAPGTPGRGVDTAEQLEAAAMAGSFTHLLVLLTIYLCVGRAGDGREEATQELLHQHEEQQRQQMAWLQAEMEQRSQVLNERKQRMELMFQMKQKSQMLEEREQKSQMLEEMEQKSQMLEEREQKSQMLEEMEQKSQMLEEREQKSQMLEEMEQKSQMLKEMEQKSQMLKEREQRIQLLFAMKKRRQMLEAMKRKSQMLEEMEQWSKMLKEKEKRIQLTFKMKQRRQMLEWMKWRSHMLVEMKQRSQLLLEMEQRIQLLLEMEQRIQLLFEMKQGSQMLEETEQRRQEPPTVSQESVLPSAYQHWWLWLPAEILLVLLAFCWLSRRRSSAYNRSHTSKPVAGLRSRSLRRWQTTPGSTDCRAQLCPIRASRQHLAWTDMQSLGKGSTRQVVPVAPASNKAFPQRNFGRCSLSGIFQYSCVDRRF
ncbi:putative mediator of RNA polymerase II transcription subunit 26 [Myiozetetes cayanensis]|uniref:putative mediator of RNA polymerase II transcription subunit 26 n=1 Tax=Myiozetetes cayanensis TaxID=478635 RepID=UPI002160EC66|nr:putative mediator of RNA polymerase II transcription subunit 26 [Myiozetetes cayanensis]